MSGGFQVTRAGLLDAASTFSAEAATFKAIMPETGPPAPDGGSAAVNDALRTVTQAIGLLHLQAAGELDNHATKLSQAHATYASTEQGLVQAISQIMTTAAPG